LKYTVIFIPALLLGAMGAYAQGGPTAGTKVGIINIQNAIFSTRDGQKALADLQAKFEPVRSRLQKKQADLEGDKAKLSQGANAMSADQKEKLMRDIDQKTKSLNRDTEDAQAESEQEQGKVMQELGQRVMAVVNKYSKDHGFSLIIDVSSQQTNVLFADPATDITGDIIKLYDQNSPGPVTGGSAAAPKPSAPKPTAPLAAPPPAAKKTAPPGAK
jgi:outer membrane protein